MIKGKENRDDSVRVIDVIAGNKYTIIYLSIYLL